MKSLFNIPILLLSSVVPLIQRLCWEYLAKYSLIFISVPLSSIEIPIKVRVFVKEVVLRISELIH